jgi:hypothetical protein
MRLAITAKFFDKFNQLRPVSGPVRISDQSWGPAKMLAMDALGSSQWM